MEPACQTLKSDDVLRFRGNPQACFVALVNCIFLRHFYWKFNYMTSLVELVANDAKHGEGRSVYSRK